MSFTATSCSKICLEESLQRQKLVQVMFKIPFALKFDNFQNYFLYFRKNLHYIRSYIADKISVKMLQFLSHVLIKIMITTFRQAFFRRVHPRSGRSQFGGLPQSPLRACQAGQTRRQNLG